MQVGLADGDASSAAGVAPDAAVSSGMPEAAASPEERTGGYGGSMPVDTASTGSDSAATTGGADASTSSASTDAVTTDASTSPETAAAVADGTDAPASIESAGAETDAGDGVTATPTTDPVASGHVDTTLELPASAAGPAPDASAAPADAGAPADTASVADAVPVTEATPQADGGAAAEAPPADLASVVETTSAGAPAPGGAPADAGAAGSGSAVETTSAGTAAPVGTEESSAGTSVAPDSVPATEAAPAAGTVPADAGTAAPADTGTAAPAAGGPLRSDRIQLVGESGHAMSLGVRTPLGKHIVRQFGDDANVWDTEQLVIERGADGTWQVIPEAGTTNETLLNGAAINGPQPLNEGDVIAVGRAEKGISRLPLTVRGG